MTPLPRTVSALGIVGAAALVLPVLALVARTPWSALADSLRSPGTVAALLLSLLTVGTATLICLVLGIPLALLLSHVSPRIAGPLRVAVSVPLVLPPLVGGLALAALLGHAGWAGPLLRAVDLRLAYTTPAVVIAQVFVAMPFLVLTVEAAFRQAGGALAERAASLGAGPWRVLLRVVLPSAAPGILSGTSLAAARALGEFGATALFAGNVEGVTRTMPLAIYSAFNGGGTSADEAACLAFLLMLLAVALLVASRAALALPRRPQGGHREQVP